MDKFVVRKNQIYVCEGLCMPYALEEFASQWYGRDLIWWIDNKAVWSAGIKGTAKASDMEFMLIYVHLTLAKYNIRLWIEWVDTLSNPADGLSRDGLLDAWTQQQNWSCREAAPPSWSALHEFVDNVLAAPPP